MFATLILALLAIGAVLSVPAVDSLRSIEEGSLRMAPISLIRPNPHNPRRKSVHETSNKEFLRLREDMQSGWRRTDPATGVLQPDGTILLLKGHRRYHVALDLGIDMIPIVVYTGLSEREQLKALHDHGTGLSLDPVEEYEAFCDLMRGGFTPAQIIATMGWLDARTGKPNRNTYDKYERVYLSPAGIQEGWKQYTEDKGSFKPSPSCPFIPDTKAMTELGSAIKADGIRHEPGKGPETKKIIKDIIARQTNKSDDTPKGAFDRKAIERIAVGLNASPFFRRLLLRLAGIGDENPNPLIESIVYFEQSTMGHPVEGMTPVRPAILDAVPDLVESAEPVEPVEPVEPAPPARSVKTDDHKPGHSTKGRKPTPVKAKNK